MDQQALAQQMIVKVRMVIRVASRTSFGLNEMTSWFLFSHENRRYIKQR